MFKIIENRFAINKEKRDLKAAMNLLIEDSALSPKYMIFTVISSVMAALGIMMNNVTILIGAMLIAPLLIPVISLSVGVGAGSIKLINHSVKSLTIGLLLSILSAALITWIIQPEGINFAIYGSFTNTNLYGIVALLAGVIGVYSWFKPNTSQSIPGVGIAVALVPPIAFAGIQIVMFEQKLLIDTLQLIFINMAGIFLAGLMTFIGFAIFSLRPTHEVEKQVEEQVEEEVGKSDKK